ncbi:testis-expressed protein 2-like [Chanos chanos]|uniref:Testis-expressed protein 2-like n=1 Tax=Chanos chanos TaxID=29144 RepID=A0A6J2WQ16_CHACN|nr:testis-expressed protein 2-like [Chanos chanos]
MEDSELIFSLDRDEEGPRERSSRGRNERLGERLGFRSSAFHVPLSPSSPGALGDLSVSAPVLLPGALSSSTSLLKSSSSSSDMESKEPASLRPKPLLSLVKSLSTEISRREPEVCLSKSDSKLHMQPWKQLVQPVKTHEGGDSSSTAPPSPGSLSPTEPRSSLMAELEDTRRKFSEAMQEPLSMLSKIIGDESGGSPKQQQRTAGPSDSPSSQGSGGGGGGTPVKGDDSVGVRRREDGSPLAVCDTPVRKPRKGPLNPCFSPELHRKLGSGDSRYEICTFGDVMQVVEIKSKTRGKDKDSLEQPRPLIPPRIPSSTPGRWLVCVGLLAYGFFVLPLPSYLTGLSLGLAFGFMMGLVVVLLLAPRRPALPQKPRPRPSDSLPVDSMSKVQQEPGTLQGWMNEMDSYDPETYHPYLTHSVYATLEGSRLVLAYPRANIPRNATFNEQQHEAAFVHTRCFQLANSKVSLLPAVLARKRVWNKKYPICIMLAEGEECEEVEQTKETTEEEERADKPLFLKSDAGSPTTLYLFGRTGREKEEWYQHLLLASQAGVQTKLCRDDSKTELCSGGGSSQGSTEDIAPALGLRELAGNVREKILLDYNSYMAQFVMSESSSPTASPSHSQSGSPTERKKFPGDPALACGDSQPAWINALIGRIFWDFLREKYWADQVAHKIQKKLSKIRLPYFMNELTLAELDMGTSMPQVLSTSKPSMDRRGLWLELEVVYTGSLQMTLETKMNLCKLGRECGTDADSVPESSRLVGSRPRLSVIADSDEESSSAGSSDEEEAMPSEPQGAPEKSTPPGADGHGGGSTSRKILRFVDKIAKSKYFQKATENEYIKKKIAEVSNMPLLLTVEVLELSGTLAVNIPPPPTDRIWYSFRVPPRLDLRVRPMLGEREVTFTHVTEWIERKLQCEFQKVFVMPNMDDLYLPLMSSGMENPPEAQHSPVQLSKQSSVDSQEREEHGLSK